MTSTVDEIELAVHHGRLSVIPIGDAADELCGHEVRGRYVERFWLPVLGPSTVVLLRHLADLFDRAPSGTLIDLAETARAIGLGERAGKNAPLRRTIARAVDFGAAQLHDQGLLVRRYLPPLSPRQLARLPEVLRLAHSGQSGATGIVTGAWGRRPGEAAAATRERALAG
ncbi:MAG: hypothetical protein M0004_07185 [Actinomycetota bacterium]|nr:hypothetical protein [Actinomycetota bacterium]